VLTSHTICLLRKTRLIKRTTNASIVRSQECLVALLAQKTQLPNGGFQLGRTDWADLLLEKKCTESDKEKLPPETCRNKPKGNAKRVWKESNNPLYLNRQQKGWKIHTTQPPQQRLLQQELPLLQQEGAALPAPITTMKMILEGRLAMCKYQQHWQMVGYYSQISSDFRWNVSGLAGSIPAHFVLLSWRNDCGNWSSVTTLFAKAVGSIPVCASVLTIELAGNRVSCEEPSCKLWGARPAAPVTGRLGVEATMRTFDRWVVHCLRTRAGIRSVGIWCTYDVH